MTKHCTIGGIRMLKIWYGMIDGEKVIDMPNRRFNTTAEPEWILGDMEKKMIKDIDKADVISENLIISELRGPIGPKNISGGVKALILAKNMPDYIVDATASGNNCAKWYLEIAKDRDLTIVLDYMMEFPEPFKILVMNTNKIVTTQDELFVEMGRSRTENRINLDTLKE